MKELVSFIARHGDDSAARIKTHGHDSHHPIAMKKREKCQQNRGLTKAKATFSAHDGTARDEIVVGQHDTLRVPSRPT